MRIGLAGVAVALGLGAAATPALADGDAANGEKIFRKCKACHTIEEGKNRVGPSLFGVVDRAVASVEGFKYSEAMTAFGGDKTWTVERLEVFLAKPKDLVPGTKMGFPGLKEKSDRADVTAYLATIR